MADKDTDNEGQRKAQKAAADRYKAEQDEKVARKLRAESGPVSVAEATQANPNPPDQSRHTPRIEAQKDAGMDENTLQEDVGLKDKKTGIQPQHADQADEVKNASAMSTQQHLIPPQGMPDDDKEQKKADKAAAAKSK